MSLREKLSVIKENLNEAKAAEELEKNKKELEIQNKELAPVRAHIKELENNRQLMVIIQGSLELKESNKTGMGMKEYAAETGKKINKETERINGLISENKEVLQSVGVNNREDLLAKPEFAEDEEIVSFKNAENQVADLKISDEALKQKLSELGVAIKDKNFSYEEAAAALSKKISEIDLEILQEKAKTPEGRPDVLEGLTKDLTGTLSDMKIDEEERDKIKVIYKMGGNNFSLRQKGASFSGKELMYNFYPDKAKELEKSFDPELVQEALKNAYHIKIEEIADRYNNKFEDTKQRGYMKSLVDEKNIHRIKQFVDQVLIARQIFFKLAKEYKEECKSEYFSLDYIESLFKHIEYNKNAAQSVFRTLAETKKELPEVSMINLRENIIFFPEIYAQSEEKDKEIQEQEARVKELNERIEEQKKIEPKIFGKKKWQEDLNNLNNQITGREEEIKKLKKDRDKLRVKSEKRLEERVDLEGRNNIEGTATEIEDYLGEIIQKEAPKNLVILYDEYKKAEEALRNI